MKTDAPIVELVEVKKYLALKAIVWIRGVNKTSTTRVLAEILEKIGADKSRMVELSALQFVDIIERGLIRFFDGNFDFLALRDFEGLERTQLNRLLEALMIYQQFNCSFNVGIFLVSSPFFLEKRRFERHLKPMIIEVSDEGEDAHDFNERVHRNLEIAAEIVGKRVTRISEEVALWLERHGGELTDEQMVKFFMMGLDKFRGETELNATHLDPVATELHVINGKFKPIFQRIVRPI